MKRAAFLLAVTLLAACPGSDDITGPKDSEAVVGSWTLTTVNNSQLPVEVQDGVDTWTISAGVMTVNENGTFSYTETGSDEADVTPGAWVRKAANTYTFNPAEKPGEGAQMPGTGVVSGNTMTLTVEGSDIVRVLQRN